MTMICGAGEDAVDDIIEQFEAATRDAGGVQRETLRRILAANGGAEYLRRFGLAARTDPESYRRRVPLCRHADIAHLIARVADGDGAPLLTGKPITSLSLSSGTTQGKPKLLPFSDELFDNTIKMYRTSYAFRSKACPIGDGRALMFIYGSKQTLTAGGLLATTATTQVYRHPRYKTAMAGIQSRSCSPDEVIFGSDFHQSLYCHFLCGLIFSGEVQFLFSTFAHSLVHAFRTLESIWEDIVSDIRHGELSGRVTDPAIRKAMAEMLKPNPTLADAIESKCLSLSNWHGVIPALWPNAKYVYGCMTGSMEPYLKKLRHYAGDLPLMSADYGASEGWIAANINPALPPESVNFTVLPDIAYFEFIPLESPGGQQDDADAASIQYIESDPVELTSVEVGKMYEVVITNFAGLYRYRLGDIVRVTGFHNASPELQFICRRSLVLTINIDKNTEKDLQLAVDEAAKLLAGEKIELVDFSSFVDKSSDPGHYVIFWELSADCHNDVLASCADRLDRAFVDAGYVSSRKVNAIGPLELRILRRGTQERIMDHFAGLGCSISQFKPPRFVSQSNLKLLDLLNGAVVKIFFSNAY